MPTNASPHPDNNNGFRGRASLERSRPTLFALPVVPTSFIGRERAVEEVSALLGRPEVRLLTLTGPGGIGKTRLALEAASIVQSLGDRDVLFIPLASNLDPELVAPAIGLAAGLDATSTQTLPDRLAIALDAHNVLLVLDNFEQLLPAAPLIAAILASCPMLQVLVTSRTPLHLSAEHEFPVSALELPQAGSSEAPFAGTPAEQLFIERARLQTNDLTPEDFASIGEICRRLDGLPLAIELAAANARIMSPYDLLNRMDRALPLLTGGPRDAPPRLQTMRNAIGWSYNLLSGEEQALFRTLGVFQGGFTLAAAEAVAPASLTAPAISLFHTLVDSSLVLRINSTTDSVRFTMLETVKEFALECLIASGEEIAARDRHLSWFEEIVGAQRTFSWFDPRGSTTLVLPGEQDNLRSALNWALERGRPEQAGQIALGLIPYLRRNGLFAEISASLDRIGDQCRETDPILFAGVSNVSAAFLSLLGETSKSRDRAIASLEVCREIGDPDCIRAGLTMLGHLTKHSDGDTAIALLTEAIEISRRMNDTWHYALDLRHRADSYVELGNIQGAKCDIAEALPLLKAIPGSEPQLAFAIEIEAWIAALEKDYDLAELRGQEALALARKFDLVEIEPCSLCTLGEVALARKSHQIALNHFQDALRLMIRHGLQSQESSCFLDFALVAQEQRDFERSAQLFGAANANWTHPGFSHGDEAKSPSTDPFEPSQENLSREQFASEYLAGQQLTRREAYNLAMSVTIAPTTGPDQNSLLSPRELEVLQQLANGHTNREIGEMLFVGKRTIDFHVTSILSKLDVDSRRAAVTVARERGLLTDRDPSRPEFASVP